MTEFQLDMPLGALRGLRQTGSEPLLLALHGWLDNAGSFLGLMECLPDRAWLALDFPGHGHSFHLPEGMPYHFIDWVGYVGSVLESLGRPVVVVGHSMGAGVAPFVAAAYPEHVLGVAMLDGLGPLTSPEEEAGSLLRRGLADWKANRPSRSLSREEGLERLARTRDVPLAAAELLARRGLSEAGYRHDPKLLWTSRHRLTEGQIQAILREVSQPALLIRPETGILGQWPTLEQRVACMPGLQVVGVEGGHHVHLSDPTPTARALQAWLTTAEAGFVESLQKQSP